MIMKPSEGKQKPNHFVGLPKLSLQHKRIKCFLRHRTERAATSHSTDGGTLMVYLLKGHINKKMI